jgi:hypothetical protein
MASSTPDSSGNHKPILTGNTVLDKLLNQLEKGDREFILRLMAELGIPTNDPMHPFLVALQYYVQILREIPAAMKSAADESFRKAATVYGSIQSNLNHSVVQIEGIRVQWEEDTKALLPEFRSAFNAAFDQAIQSADVVLQKKVEGYRQEINKINATALREWSQELVRTRNLYLSDVFWQGLVWASTATAIALVVVAGSAYWLGTRQGQVNAAKEFGDQDWYTISQQLINRADNKQRLLRCNQDRNVKCTLWMEDPPQQ